MNQAHANLTVRIDDSDWERLRRLTEGRVEDVRPAFRAIHTDMKVRVDSVFARLRQGGTHRGVHWNYFAPQYTRKTDGVVVPAWGGVKKIRGKGTVKGRRRPSGQRVREGDAIGQDTVNLRRGALLSVRMSRRRLLMGSNVEYADEFASRRPFAFFHLPTDLTMMRRRLLRYLETGKV